MGRRAMVCGKGRIAIRCTDLLLEHGMEVVGVVPDYNDDGEDDWKGSLLHHAQRRGLQIRREKLTTEASAIWLREADLEFIFSFQYYEILRAPVFTAARSGTINLHFAPLPRYRGCYPVAWSLINGERQMGITLHYIDGGIDTGDVIAQRFFPIAITQNARDLFERCIEEGADLFRDTLPAILAGTNPRIAQDDSSATYYGMRSLDFRRREIDWAQPTEKLFDWVRAFAFPPLQFAEMTANAQVFRVARTERRLLRPLRRPGTVVDVSAEGVLVSTLDGALLITAFGAADGSLLAPLPTANALRVGSIIERHAGDGMGGSHEAS